MINLSGKIAVVFAATGEIGSAVATAFASYGAKVYLSGRNKEKLDQLAKRIKSDGGWVETERVDAMNEGEIDAYLSKITSETGCLDVVFNGIGIRPSEFSYGVSTLQLSLDHFMEPLRVHLGSQFLTARTAAKYMIDTASKGTILTLSASLSRLKIPFMAGITSACAGIEGLSRGLAGEFGSFGIKVICINPTALPETRTIRETNVASAATMGITAEALSAGQSAQYLLQRSPSLKDVGNMAAFLATDVGDVLNSHVIDVDCGTFSVI